MRLIALVILALGLSAGETSAAPSQTVLYTGVNLAGGEFATAKDGVMPEYGRKYIYPNAQEVEYFTGKGMNIFRIPCRWENLQNAARQPLVKGEVERLRAVVKLTAAKNAVAIIDPHNYARYAGKQIGDGVSAEDFADFWGRMAAEFKDEPRVWFGLMNEPHDLKDPKAWVDAANAATLAIRAAGAANLLLVPGNHWTSAGTWTANGDRANSVLMAAYKDPLDHFAFEVHLYLDKDNSGTHKEVVSADVGVNRARRFTEWCRERKVRGFLGEFAAPLVPQGEPAIRNLLTYMDANRDVWLGWTWWAAGPWWGDYMFTIEPKGGADRPQLAWLLPHLRGAAPVQFTAAVGGGSGGGPLAAGGQHRLAAKGSFSRWEGDVAFLDDPRSPTPLLRMPNRDIVLRAVGGGGARPAVKPADAAPAPAPAPVQRPVLAVPAARAAWVARLREAAAADAAAGRGPRFVLAALKSPAVIQAIAGDGTMTLAIEGSGAMTAPWAGLRESELAGIASDLARGDAPARQALAGFFLMLNGEAEAARLRLMRAGEGAAEVEAAFAR